MGAGTGHFLPEEGGRERKWTICLKSLASFPNVYETVEEEQGSYDKLT